MKTKMSNAAKIRSALRAGETAKEISQRLKVPISTVYTVNWKMKNGKTVTRKAPFVIDTIEPIKKSTPLADFIGEEIKALDYDIDRLQIIRAFLSLRRQQLGQNGE
jgi:hypothetical protein